MTLATFWDGRWVDPRNILLFFLLNIAVLRQFPTFPSEREPLRIISLLFSVSRFFCPKVKIVRQTETSKFLDKKTWPKSQLKMFPLGPRSCRDGSWIDPAISFFRNLSFLVSCVSSSFAHLYLREPRGEAANGGVWGSAAPAIR